MTEIHYTFSTLKIILLVIILTAINLCNVKAENTLTLNFPNSINELEEFEVSIDSTDNKISDVKIYIHNSQDEKITRSEVISKIFDSEWKDSWFYITSSFPSKKLYKLKSESYSPGTELCLQIRPNNKTTYDKICLPIKIIQSSSQEDNSIEESNQDNQQEELDLSSEENSEEENYTSLYYLDNSAQAQYILYNSLKNQDNSVIHLSPKTKNQSQFYTKEYYLEKIILYSFLLISALALFLMFRKKI